jgi:membrane-associated protease RseP (regulator of RpoE activity)
MVWIFVIALLIHVIAHELGHLLAAIKVGCGVDKFSIGFGKPVLYSREFKGIVYQLTPWILGGYVSLKGELEKSRQKDAFTNLRYRDKLIVTMAGVVVNIVLGGISLGILILYKEYLPLVIRQFLGWFGYIGICLGIGNALPIPALDGSYPILIGLEKIYGKEKGYKLIRIIMRVGFIVLMTAQIALLPYLIILWKGILK